MSLGNPELAVLYECKVWLLKFSKLSLKLGCVIFDFMNYNFYE